MSLLSKVEVTITFPLGAIFHQDIVEETYKQFLKMIKRISCINIGSKCNNCSLGDNCQYYIITGKNFSGYPGIIFKKELYQEDIFTKNEDYTYDIYLIGNCERYRGYIEIFFKEYLRYRLFGIDFLLKKIEYKQIENKYKNVNCLLIKTIIETTDFISAYNNMMHYYNAEYGCNYCFIDNINSINSIKIIDERKVSLNTKVIRKRGYIYQVGLDEMFSSDLELIGIGKYNYLGGGKFAFSSKDEK